MALAALALGFNSCSEDRGPKYQDPKEFTLNTPVMQDQYIVLESGNTLELVCSQPDYGYSALANYSAEMSLTPSFENIAVVTPTDVHQARMVFKQNDIAIAYCEILGLDSEEAYEAMFPNGMDFQPLYFRAVCQLDGIEGSLIRSNVVQYNNVKAYFAVPDPGKLWVVGDLTVSWSNNEGDEQKYIDAGQYLSEPMDGIGTMIYTGVLTLPESPIFRFYSQLGDWENNSYGYQVDDKATDFDWSGTGEFSEKLVEGKGSFQFPDFPGGEVTITVDLSDPNNMIFTMKANGTISGGGTTDDSLPEQIYMVSDLTNWSYDSAAYANGAWCLYEVANTGVYANTFDIPADLPDAKNYLACRFYSTLDGSAPARWGAKSSDGKDIQCELETPYTTAKSTVKFLVLGIETTPEDTPDDLKEYSGVAGRKLRVILNTNDNQVSFRFVE